MRNQTLAHALTKKLESDSQADARPVVVLGVGSELRSDDAAGLRVAARLARRRLAGVHVREGGTAPENLTGEISRLAPSHLVIVDAADMGEAPGTVRLFGPEVIGGASFSTHGLPLGIWADFIRREAGCSVIFIGIQPKSLELGGAISGEVSRGIRRAVHTLAVCLGSRGK